MKQQSKKEQQSKQQRRQERDLSIALAKASHPAHMETFKTTSGATIRF
jgi:hypothetical protein